MMTEECVNLQIDGKTMKAKPGMSILEAARETTIEIPTLCYYEKLNPYGACRICSVEIARNGEVRIVTACGYPVTDGVRVKTRSPKIDKIRKTLLEFIMLLLPDQGSSGEIGRLAAEYGADVSHLISKSVTTPNRCILCGRCVRYCSEVVGIRAIGFVGRGVDRRVIFFPERTRFCPTCRECFEICPTGKIAAETDGANFPGFSIVDYLAGKT
jgi:NADH dehydrogenase/NADH:ubiquinone oxidoreductase subunit G